MIKKQRYRIWLLVVIVIIIVGCLLPKEIKCHIELIPLEFKIWKTDSRIMPIGATFNPLVSCDVSNKNGQLYVNIYIDHWHVDDECEAMKNLTEYVEKYIKKHKYTALKNARISISNLYPDGCNSLCNYYEDEQYDEFCVVDSYPGRVEDYLRYFADYKIFILERILGLKEIQQLDNPSLLKITYVEKNLYEELLEWNKNNPNCIVEVEKVFE